MAQLNTTRPSLRTHEGAPAKRVNPVQALRRAVMTCLLWEGQFYIDGVSIARRIVDLVKEVGPKEASAIAIEARREHNLRHVPLLIVSAMAKEFRGDSTIRETIPEIVRRADELSELVAVHCAVNGVGPDKAKKVLSAQMKRGLAQAFRQFDEYQLAKYDRPKAIKLRDVLFMVHAKPEDKPQEAMWKRLVDGNLKTPDTWETNLSAGEDKKATFERLLRENRLGYLALLRNLRNMIEAGVDDTLVRDAIRARKGAGRVLPFRFMAAAKYAPKYEPDLDVALMENIKESPALPGKTVVLVDVSGSMSMGVVSAKSELSRMEAAATLGSVVHADNLRVFTFSWDLVEVPPRHGMAGVDAINQSQRHVGTDLGGAIRGINNTVEHDRLIVITDEQSHTPVPDPVAEKAYMINVASYENGVGYGRWTHIDGFSEAVLKYIHEIEQV